MDEPLTYTVRQAAAILGISAWSYYEGIKRGDLPALRPTPNRIVVPKAALQQLLDRALKDAS